MNVLRHFYTSFCAKVLPTSCIACEVFQEKSLCSNCAMQLAERALFHYECCSQCGITLEASEVEQQRCMPCTENPPYFDETYCLDRYDGPLQAALHALKYQKRLAYAHGLASAWNQFFSTTLQREDARYLLPVPLSKEKLCTRGFNQSWEIARRIQTGGHMEKLAHALLRQHHLQQQALSTKAERILAIRAQFYINPRHLLALQNQSVVIFDDVMTTGATLNEIARILKDNGVSRVINWVLLRTARPSQPQVPYV